MLEMFGIQEKDLYPVCVVATMSSGKSTFINAVLGEAVLPEGNEACTARVIAVLNNERSDRKRAYIVKESGERGYVETDNPKVMEKINADDTVKDILVEMNISSLPSFSKQLLLIDTPGVNNSEDKRHAERTEDLLKHLDRGVIIYLMNATQPATNDDALFLSMVSDYIKKHEGLHICFVLNKIDELDEEKENIEEFIKTTKTYIESLGFAQPVIYPLSAYAAKILRLKLNGKKLTKTENRLLQDIYEEYQAAEKNMLRYTDMYHKSSRNYEIGDREITEYELKRAIENTGIQGIEHQIASFIFQDENYLHPPVFNTENFTELNEYYSGKRKSKNTMNYTGRIHWICRACRQVNGENEICLDCGKPNLIWHIAGQ